MKKIIITIIIALILIVIGFYIFEQFQEKKLTDNENINTIIKTKKITTAVDVSGWQKYQSKKNNVEFKYPAGWKIRVGGGDIPELWGTNKNKNYFYFKKNLEAKIIVSTAEAFSPGGGNFITLYKFSLKNNGELNDTDKNTIKSLVGENVVEIGKYTTKYLPNNKTIFIKKHPENIGPAYVFISLKKAIYVLETQNPGGGYSSKYLDIAVKIAETITPL